MTEAGSPQQIAEACGARLYELDHAARAMGVTLDSIEPGCARMSLTVRDDMVNSHGICHGGVIFSLADSAFAYSSNSRNQRTVAAGATIDYVSAARRPAGGNGRRTRAAGTHRHLRRPCRKPAGRPDSLLPRPLLPSGWRYRARAHPEEATEGCSGTRKVS